MSDSIWPEVSEQTYSVEDLQNLTYGADHKAYPATGQGSSTVIQDSSGTILDADAYDRDINVGFTNPNLHRRVDIQDPETNVNQNLLGSVPNFYESDGFLVYQIPLVENLIAGKEYTLQLWNVNISYIDVTPSADKRLFVFWGGRENYECVVEVPDGHVGHAILTFVANNSVSPKESNNLWINIYDGFAVELEPNQRNIRIGCWKLELGHTATPLIKELAPHKIDIAIRGTNSYRTTTYTVHNEESTTTEIP